MSNYKLFLIQVDIYGKCGPLSCPRKDKECWDMVERDYFFYLSFENSLCKDYITEKFFNAMARKIIPIVLGGSLDTEENNTSNDYIKGLEAPEHSFINARKYSSPKVLADYLNKIYASPKLYAEYFWWKEYYDVQMIGLDWKVHSNDKKRNANLYCDMCRRVHEEPGKEKRNRNIIGDLYKYWDVGSKCQSKYFSERRAQL